MISRSKSALRKPTAQRKPAGKKSGKPNTGNLPEWNLADLYSGIHAPEIARDLAKLDVECVGFETDYKGKLSEHTAAEGGGQWLAQAIWGYKALGDLDVQIAPY